jgi:DNA recombination protein RmuC
LEHATRELLLRLESLEERLAKMECGCLESMSLIRESVSASARSDREEIARSFAAFSESQSRHIRDFAEIHRSALDSLSDRIEKFACYDGGRFVTPNEPQGGKHPSPER